MNPSSSPADVPVIRVCLVEDHQATREAFAKLLEHADGISCVGVCTDGEQAVSTVPGLFPDVVLMDINLPGQSGIECVATLKRAHPQIDFVMLTTYDDTELIFKALRAGASGYLLKRAAPEELVGAITEVRRGGSPMSMEIARRVVSHFHEISEPAREEESLTNREQEILGLLAKGLSYKLIAERLDLSTHTVHNHLRRIYRKLHVQSGMEAVAKFLGR